MSDFKWQMQERIDAGMNPDAAYEATRESYLDAADQKRKEDKETPRESRFTKGQKVMRYLSSARIPMPMIVTNVHEGLVSCGPWTFDDASGIEEDPELGWGASSGITGSWIEEISEAEWEAQRVKT